MLIIALIGLGAVVVLMAAMFLLARKILANEEPLQSDHEYVGAEFVSKNGEKTETTFDPPAKTLGQALALVTNPKN